MWARADAFAAAPGGTGWQDRRGHEHRCADFAELARVLGEDAGGRVELVWTPANTHMVVPEELPGLLAPLGRIKRRWAREDQDEALRRMRWFAVLAVVAAAWAVWRGGLAAVWHSVPLGMVLLAWVVFGMLPWWQACRRLRVLAGWDAQMMAARVAEMRFETWLGRQRAPVTYALLVVMAGVGLVQLGVHATSWQVAGLVKQAYLHGQWWRLLTAPWLHGHPVHWFLNASALHYLGRRVEVMARWPHLVLVFGGAAVVGGLASVQGNPFTPTIGASGGIMGLLGFLLVFETLHARLVPVPARRRLLAAVALTGFIGALAYEYVDNWAHLGGLLGGLAYAAIVFPRSASPHRPRATRSDVLAGTLCGLVLVGAAVLAVWLLLGRG